MKVAGDRRKILLLLIVCVLVATGTIAAATKKTLELTGKNAFEALAADQIALTRIAAASLEDSVSLRLEPLKDAAAVITSSKSKFEDSSATVRRLQDEGNGLFLCAGILNSRGKILAYPLDAAVEEAGDLLRPKIEARASAESLNVDISGDGHMIAWAPVGSSESGSGVLFAFINSQYIKDTCLKPLSSRLGRHMFLLDERGKLLLIQPKDAGGEHQWAREAQVLPQAFSCSNRDMEGLVPLHEFKEENGRSSDQQSYLAYAPVQLPGKRVFLGIGVPGRAVSGYLVRSAWPAIGLAATWVLAIATCVVLFYFFDKRRLKAKEEALELREEQALLAQLEESEERYKTLVENLQSSVVIFRDGCIKFSNRAFHSLTLYSPEEVAAEDFDMLSLVHEKDRPLVARNIARVLDGEKLDDPRELRYVKRNGEIIIGLTFSSLIHYEGKRAVESVVVDITRMKNMEREFEETKKRLQYLLDNAPIMIFSLDQSGNFSYANKETLRITGYRFDDWVGRPFAPIVHPDDLALAVSQFEAGRRGIPRRDYKLRIRNSEGKLRTLQITADNIWEEEQFKGSLIIASDITEQQRLQHAIKETRDHLANIIENAGDAIITLDTGGNVISWNKSAESMFHFVEPDTFHKPLHLLLNVNTSLMAELIVRVNRGGTIRDVEIECDCDTARLDMLFTFSPIKDIAGKVIGISCFAKDITERRNFEKQLERDKLFIDQLIESANALVAAANEKGNIVIFNRRFEDVSGYTKSEALGHNPLELLVPKEYRKMVSERFRSIRGEPVVEIEIPIISKEGKQLMVTWNAAAVNLPSGHAAVVVVGQDVTNQKRMQEELIQSKKLASIGELVSGVAHELNNPLTVIMGYSQLLIAEQSLQDRHRQMAQKVLDAAGRSKRIVENLLAFARKKKLQKQQVNINQVIENTLSLREHNFAVNNVAIKREYEQQLPLIYADGHQLQQVFLNLINNAFDSMSEANHGGNLEVRTSKTNGLIVIEVIDDGPGVPEAIQDKIFDPFFTTKEVGKGTGLGMSLSYGIVREHGGRIYLDRTFRPGAKFVIEFSANASAPAHVSQV
jgi:PAS domain S-box-containing protein